MTLRRAIATALVVVALWPDASLAGPYSQIVVFGDSLSDTGNVDDLTFGFVPGPEYWQGRFSNGPLWVEHVAGGVGLPAPTPSRDNGFNYAFGGAETGGGSTNFVLPNLGRQIDDYLNEHRPNGNILYTVWGGGNDFLEGDTTNPAVPAANLADHVRTLAAAGGRNFVVPNLPLMGQLPRHRGTGRQGEMDARSRQFNALLAETMDSLQQELGLTIFQPDVQSFFEQVIADPGAVGLSNVTEAALDHIGEDPDRFLFFDDIHPTASGHRLLGAQIASLLVPVETHAFVSAASTASWTNSQAWAPTGVPTADWNAQVFNWRNDRGQEVVVEGNRRVNRLSVEGRTRPMRVLVGEGASLEASEDVEIIGSGSIVVQDGTLIADRIDLRGGLLSGNGTVRGDVFNAGEITAGSVGGSLRIEGDFRQSDAGSLAVFVGGLATNRISQVEITGAATLNGSLSVYAVDDFEILPGDRFEFLTYASREGDFLPLDFDGPVGLSLVVDYDDKAGIAALLANALGGDADLDGMVTLGDLNILRDNWQAEDLVRGWRRGDFNHDGLINIADLVITAEHWQQGAGSPLDVEAFLADVHAVPEPSAILLLLAGIALLARRPERRPSCSRSPT